MDSSEQIHAELQNLIKDFVNEPAYQKVYMLSQPSQNLCFQMQSNLVNANHIWGDVLKTDDPAVRSLSLSVSVKNLQTFVEAIAAARELYLILPDRLVDYQDRAEKIIMAMQKTADSTAA